MAMHTGLKLHCLLRPELQNSWHPILEYMFTKANSAMTPPPLTHPLALSPKWPTMLHSDSEDMPDYSSVTLLSNTELSIRFSINNQGGEIQKFLDWISPYVDKIFLAKYRHEQEQADRNVATAPDGKLTLH